MFKLKEEFEVSPGLTVGLEEQSIALLRLPRTWFAWAKNPIPSADKLRGTVYDDVKEVAAWGCNEYYYTHTVYWNSDRSKKSRSQHGELSYHTTHHIYGIREKVATVTAFGTIGMALVALERGDL
ncbi:hypothetical protein SERLADRAFT_416467 [Serpula lacrymans var. lacrymans S7.9]|uniref:Uncharacterized protein n=1 Tax=Serpula lacrymans var. lacrymans (strain S7.9) TaxID=578457 RepID=F8P173_SERL9|nr:uncharacterized protein SERLADRAFT_416467 [Serpula lacrymans var. lacrymans S7.9]EGO22904.1 hypothetical protein SERLADRAFT_416467 [Serpula lacrymans var. lacrymans S7.9]